MFGLTKVSKSAEADQLLFEGHAVPDSITGPYASFPIHTLNSEIKWVTPSLARSLRDTCEFEWQRPVKIKNVDRLAFEMKGGRFLAGSPIVMAVLPDNSMRLLNGNHTMEAIYKADITIPMTFIYHRVKDIAAAGAIYAVLDIQKIRTWTDSLKGTGRGDFPLAPKVMSAVGLIASSFKYDGGDSASQSRGSRFDLMEVYSSAAAVMHTALMGSPRVSQRFITRSAIFAVALETARYRPSDAFEFWSKVAQNDGLTKGDPERALLTYCANHPVVGGSDNNVHAKAAALAWNAYFKDERLEVCKPNAMGNFMLLGTPWSKSKKA